MKYFIPKVIFMGGLDPRHFFFLWNKVLVLVLPPDDMTIVLFVELGIGDVFHAAPNIDHSQDFVRRDIKDWLNWLRNDIGFDGWRLDFVR
jgi:hypothetical protein